MTGKVLGLRAAALVMQDEIWEGNDGPQRIDDMDPRRQRALLRWLRAHAAGLHHARETDVLLSIGYSVEHEREYQRLRALDPRVWLEDTPLVRRLATLCARRKFLAHPRRWWR